MVWQTGDLAILQNALSSAVNAFANYGLGVLSALGTPGGLVFSAIYSSMDDVFRKGRYFEPEAWRDAINRALVEAGAQDVLSRGRILNSLYLEFGKLIKNILEMQDRENDRRTLRQEINRQLEAIRREIERYRKTSQEAGLLEAVSHELKRQPTYVINLVRDYEAYTGIRLSSGSSDGVMSEGGGTLAGLDAATMPLNLLLFIRAREESVQRIEGKINSGRRHDTEASATGLFTFLTILFRRIAYIKPLKEVVQFRR